MADIITLKELLSIIVRRGKTLIALGAALAVLLGAYSITQSVEAMSDPENTAEFVEEKYQKDLDAYEKQQYILNEQLLSVERNLESQQQHLNTSILMHLDSSHKPSTSINLAITVTSLPQADFDQAYLINGSPTDYIIARIQNQYLVLWSSLNLETIFGDELTDKQWREIVTLQGKNGGLLELSTCAKTLEESEDIAQKAYKTLIENVEIVSKSAYPHELMQLSVSSKIAADPNLEKLQMETFSAIEQYKEQLITIEGSLNELKEPQRVELVTVGTTIRDTIKYGLLGAFLGCVLAAIWIVAGSLFGNKMIFSDYLEQNLKIPLMMSLSVKDSLFDRLADRILGERVWPDKDSATAYLKQSAVTRLEPGAKVALLSSLPFQQNEHIQSITATLEGIGHSVCFIDNAGYNADMLTALADNDCVILVERRGVSRTKSIELLIALSNEQQKPIKGFILI